jgi:hypothetical protein
MLSPCRNSGDSPTRRRTLGYIRSTILVLVFLFCDPGLFSAEAFPFQIPEVFNYDLAWTGVKAGEASLGIREDRDGITITSTAKSSKWVSVFYTVDDIVESRLLKNREPGGVGLPANYRLNIREGRYRKKKEVIFDQRNEKVLYIDHLEKERSEFTVPAAVFDPMSSFYYLRTLDLKVGSSVYVTIFDSKKVWNVEVQVLRKEEVEVPAGHFNTIVVKPLMKSEGIFFRRGEIYIWLTDDEKRLPVMLKTKVKIGWVTASLVGGKY